MAIARRILAGDPETKEGYFRFLKGGCSRTPVELLKLVGLDMEEPEVVNEAVKVFEGLLDEMEELAKRNFLVMRFWFVPTQYGLKGIKM